MCAFYIWQEKGSKPIVTSFDHTWGLGRVRQVIQPRVNIIEPPHDKTNKMACAPSEDSDQPGHLMGNSGPKLSSCGQRRL